MPLTQEKRLDNFSNNNDHSYLHKKFKKMASTMAMLPGSSIKGEENGYQGNSLLQVTSSSTITNGSIAAAHPEIEKIKDIYDKRNVDVEKNVQTNFNDENFRFSDVNNFVQIPGKTSFAEEFLNKTENLENDFIKETYSGGTGRYICPYCKISCAKPSVLQKHIRAHTNERPYPCIPCGFAFKTKSNLYKHRRSRTHALRLQGADIASALNDDELSGDSESDTSIPPTSLSGSDRDQSSDTTMIRSEKRPNEFSSPELSTENNYTSLHSISTLNDNNKSKAIYKPKFRAAFYHGMDDKDKIKKTISQNADFLTEHISKIISDNEAIVDVIETPLQKKYGKIKQIAESKQLLTDIEMTPELTPLNLTKNCYDTDNVTRKRSHSDSFAQIIEDQKHPLNPEGSIIKDLLLKTKANGHNPLTSELVDGLGPLYICPLCQIVYRSADNLEIHRLYYCKGALSNNSTVVNSVQKEIKSARPENIFIRSNSINVRLPENVMTPVSRINISTKSPPLKNKPDNLVILKPDRNDVIAPLPSPGPLLGNTRLVDTRMSSEFNKKAETLKIRPKESSPKRRIDSRSESYSPRSHDNSSPRSADLYSQPKIRCMEINPSCLRSMEEISPHVRHNSTSLQMFGGEVKIVDHSGSTTTLRIEPSKTQLSPILIHQNLSPSKYANDSEASSVVVRSGLHSGGTIVHNPPTPKETISQPQIQTPRIPVSTPAAQFFQFPPLSAITAYNPLTLPPLSPSSSPNGATTIFHGGKLIPHVPGIPGPNTPGLLISNKNTQIKNSECIKNVAKSENISDNVSYHMQTGKSSTNYDRVMHSKSPNIKPSHNEIERHSQNKDNFNVEVQSISTVPIIKIRNVDEPVVAIPYPANNDIKVTLRTEGVKRNADGFPKVPVLNSNYQSIKKNKDTNYQLSKNVDSVKPEIETKKFNFENLITKVEIYNNQMQSSLEVQKNCNTPEISATILQNERSETSYFQKNATAKSLSEERKPKFLRPSTLPLKPGTFTPKKHHGITPNANTMPLISPETPRPAKAYGQLYLNGNAYTYLGLKCSTKVFYCTINRPQPTYVPNQHFLSMYSNWQLLSELTPDPLGLSASSAMSLYDSRHRPQNVAVAVIKQDLILTHSSQWNKNSKDSKQIIPFVDTKKSEELRSIAENIATSKKELTGGFESNEEYTYVRGRGRGRYVCSECGIRCKKPSMLKKHIRTHTDVRPYTCVHCVFSFKTKGNLTKHMKSKAHYKKCCELGINPNEGNDVEGVEMAQCSGETDDDTDSEGDEGNEGETESSDTEICKSRLPEHEAAHCLLSLGGSRPATSATPGLITSARPSTYPYTPISLEHEADISPEKLLAVRTTATIDSRMEVDNEPMDLSKNELRPPSSVPEIPTARESSVLASLASNTAKLPQHQSQWANGEPMLHTYLTERALLDSKIKQSQLACSPKTRKIDLENSMFPNKDGFEKNQKKSVNTSSVKIVTTSDVVNRISVTKDDKSVDEISHNSTMITNNEPRAKIPANTHSENAKSSEYSQHTRVQILKTFDNCLERNREIKGDESNKSKITADDVLSSAVIMDENFEVNEIKQTPSEYDSGKSVVDGTEFDGTSDTSEKLLDDDRRVCYFCNETFTKPPRPFRCIMCAVSFRMRAHLLVHERSASHNIKLSMTSNSENAKHVVSEYLKQSRVSPINSLDDSIQNRPDVSDESNGSRVPTEEKARPDDNFEGDRIKFPLSEYEHLGSKDGTDRKDFEKEDEWKDCNFCNKMFREPEQLKLHLNIHYMERPFRCSVCAVSNRTVAYPQTQERSIHQHTNKVMNKPNSENAKHVVSQYLKHARINPTKTLDDPLQNHLDVHSDESNGSKSILEEKAKMDDSLEGDGIKLPPNEYDSVAPKVVIGVGGVAFKITKGKDLEGGSYSPGKLMEDGRRVCDFCNKTFTKPSQLRLHLNIHYMERPFRCSVCAVSFRTRGHLQKHERSASHHNKVSMTSTFGAATSFNPRPFRCSDCNIAFRIHGHLAKHLRSKMHVMRLECLFKLPFGTFTEIERAGLSLTDIDTTDCASSLASLQSLARKLHEKDPTKLEYREPSGSSPVLPATGRDSSEEEDAGTIAEKTRDSENDNEIKTIENNIGHDTELRVNYSATDN